MAFSRIRSHVWPCPNVSCSQPSGEREGRMLGGSGLLSQGDHTFLACFCIGLKPQGCPFFLFPPPPTFHLFPWGTGWWACLSMLNFQRRVSGAAGCGILGSGSGWFYPHLWASSWASVRDRDPCRVRLFIFCLMTAKGRRKSWSFNWKELNARNVCWLLTPRTFPGMKENAEQGSQKSESTRI